MMSRDLNWWVRKMGEATTHPDLAVQRLTYNTRRFVVDQQCRFGKYNYRYKIIFLAGMAMGGSTWMKNLLGRIPGIFTRHTPMPIEIAYNQGICDTAFSHIPRHGNTLFKTHLDPTPANIECLFRNGVEKVLITHRDLRDILIARYHRLIAFPKSEDAFDYIDYNDLGKEKALDHSIDIVADEYAKWILDWIDIAEKKPEQFCFVKFEEMKADTKIAFKRVLDFYEISLTENKIEEIVEAAKGRGTMKQNLAAAKILPWGVSSNFRSGKIGNWKNELTDTQINRCKTLMGDTLIKLGYEQDLNWSYDEAVK
jgi:hypothetical protein